MNKPYGDCKNVKFKKINRKKNKANTKTNKNTNKVEEVLVGEPKEEIIVDVQKSTIKDAKVDQHNSSVNSPEELYLSFDSSSSSGTVLDPSISETDYVSLNSGSSFKSNDLDETLKRKKSFEFQIPSIPTPKKTNSVTYLDDTKTLLETSVTDSLNEIISHTKMDDTLNLVEDLPFDSIPKEEAKQEVVLKATSSSNLQMNITEANNLLINLRLEVKLDSADIDRPDLPENVRSQTQVILSSLIKTKISAEIKDDCATDRSDEENESDSVDSHGSLYKEIDCLPQALPGSMEESAAKCVADIGDRIMILYENRLNEMIDLIPDDLCPVDMFRQVTNQIFKINSLPNWGQVVTLMYFGYLLIRKKINSGLLKAFRQILDCIQSLFFEGNIFGWIAQQGGWRVLQHLRLVDPNSEDSDRMEFLNSTHTVISRVGQQLVDNRNLANGIVISATVAYAVYLLLRKIFRN